MLTPIQSTILPLDALRQQITPQAPVQAPPPPPLTDTPVQPGATAKDKFNPNSGGRNSSGRDSAEQEQQKSAIADRLNQAYLQLTQLQESATQALQAGDAQRAQEVAQEAAQLAGTIQNTVGQLPPVDFNSVAFAAEQQLQQSQSQGAAAASTPVDVPAALDTARAGLGAAITVVDTAAAIPAQTVQNQTALDGMRRQVLDAMAGLETVAERVTAAQPSSGGTPTPHLDIRA